MKNPISFLKHVAKDPINTMAEAEVRKKEIMPWLYGSIALAVIPSLLGVAVTALSFLTIFGLIGIFATVFFGYSLSAINKVKGKFKALTCNKCNTVAEIKTPEEFAKYVSYTIGKNEAVFKGVCHPSTQTGVVSKVTAQATATVEVEIDLTCPHCGNTKKLKYTVVPFKCSESELKVYVRDLETVKLRFENAMRSVVADYNDPDKRKCFGYSIHSKKNPKYELRYKLTTNNDTVAFPRYNGVTIDYHRDVEEMVEVFFLENQVDGKIVEI